MGSNNVYDNKGEQVLQEDNPCWGSSEECDLEYLLSKVSKDEAILYESTNYVILNKPPDLRMDGPYKATVHKLLTYWYPPPSLEGYSGETFIQEVSKLHQHNHLADNALRPCHQLDYATSGVLCVARSHEAASVASQLFEDRKVQKSYLAVVNGSFHIRDNAESLPILTMEKMQSTLRALEQAYRNSRSKRRQDTFAGFQPPHALFNKFKSMIRNQSTTNHCNNTAESNPSKKKKRKRPSPLTDENWSEIWRPVRDQSSDESLENMNWKQLCKTNKEWKQAFQLAATIHNDLLRDALFSEQPQMAPSLPTLFQVENDRDSVYIFCPLAQVKDDFGMKIPQPVAKAHDLVDLLACKNPDDDELDFKPSLTKCTVLESCSYKGGHVTKVRLWPITGRRHQLRVHMALSGHAILGDVTYESSSRTETANKRKPPRMCLHAQSLSLALLGEPEGWKIMTPDPFVIQGGKLELTTA